MAGTPTAEMKNVCIYIHIAFFLLVFVCMYVLHVCMYTAMRQLLQQLVDGGGHIGPLLSPESSSLRTDKGTMIEVGRLCEVARAVSITTCSVLGSFLSQV